MKFYISIISTVMQTYMHKHVKYSIFVIVMKSKYINKQL